MVMGMVTLIAKEFYSLDVQMKLVEERVEEGTTVPYHYLLSIDMVNGGRDLGRELCVV